MTLKTVTATKTMAATSNTFEFNFNDAPLFPHYLPIISASCSIALVTGFAQHAMMRPASGQLVKVEADSVVAATVAMTARRSTSRRATAHDGKVTRMASSGWSVQ